MAIVWLVRPPKQQRRPLPSLLSVCSYMAGIPEARMGSCHSVASLLADRLSLAAAAGEGDGGPSGTPIYVQ